MTSVHIYKPKFEFCFANNSNSMDIKSISDYCFGETYPIKFYEKMIKFTIICKAVCSCIDCIDRIASADCTKRKDKADLESYKTSKIVGFAIVDDLDLDLNSNELDGKLSIFSHIENDRSVCTFLVSLAVLPEFRRKKIGANLIKICKKLTFHDILLHVRVKNETAIDLYNKMNFHFIGRLENYYINPVEDAFVMVCIKDQFTKKN